MGGENDDDDDDDDDGRGHATINRDGSSRTDKTSTGADMGRETEKEGVNETPTGRQGKRKGRERRTKECGRGWGQRAEGRGCRKP